MGDSRWESKLDPYSRRILDPAARQDEGEGFDITVRLTSRDAAVTDLADAGLEVQATIGDIVAGHVPDRITLVRVAQLSCVAEVQAARSLYSDRHDGKRSD